MYLKYALAGLLVLTFPVIPAQAVGDPPVTVAVLDTGITVHPSLGWHIDSNGSGRPKRPLVPGFDFVSDSWQAADGDGWDPDPTDRGDGVRGAESTDTCAPHVSTWHGTNVIGTVRSIATQARVIPVRIMGRCGGNTADVAAAVLWSAGLPVPGVPTNEFPADIINLSLSGASDGCPRALSTAIDAAIDQGVVVVAAAGSYGREARRETPANCPGVLVVGSTDAQGTRTFASGYGPEVALSALGGDARPDHVSGIRTTTNLGRYRPGVPGFGHYMSSSAATARVSASLALLAAANPSLRGQALTDSLMDHIEPFAIGACDVGEGLCGAGIVSLRKVRNSALS